MKTVLALLVPMLLIAGQDAGQHAGAAEDTGPITRQTANRESPLLDFEYSWPEAISPQTQLIAILKDDLAKSYDEATANARENKAMMDANNGPFNQNMFNRAWTLEGETARLISLIANTDTFTGGAHPNHDSKALLWDRTANVPIDAANLFTSPAAFETALRPAFCKALDAERAARRKGERLDGEFSQCPPFGELTIAPADANRNRRFELFRIVADPYVAGPYAEGEYEIAIPVSASVAAAIKPEFRSDFED